MGLSRGFREVFSSLTRKKLVTRDVNSTHLHRCLGAVDLTFIGVGCMVGAGAFLLPGQVAGVLGGPAALFAFFLSGSLALLCGLCCIECALQLPETGASYLFAYVTLGELAAFLAGWACVASRLLSLAYVAQVWSAYLDDALGGAVGNATVRSVLGGREWDAPGVVGYPDLVAGLLVLVCGVLVSAGTDVFSKANSLFVVTTLLTLALVFIVAAVHADFTLVTEHGFAPEGVGFDEILAGTITAYLGYAGYEAIALAAEEAKEQSRDLLIGLLSALGISMFVYIAGVLSVAVLTEYSDIDLKTPFETVFNDLDGLRWMKYVVAIGALCSITGGTLSVSYALSRFVYPMSRDGLLPPALSNVNERTKTPLLANSLGTCISTVLAVFMDIRSLLQLSSVLYTFETIAVIFSVIILRYTPPKRSEYVELVDRDRPKGISSANTQRQQETTPLGFLNRKPEARADTDATTANELPKSPSWIRKVCAAILGRIRDHPSTSVVLSLWVHLVSEFLLVALLTFKMDDLRELDPGLILGTVASGALTLISCGPLLILPQHTDELRLKVPWMPFLPLIGLLAAVALLQHVEILAYIQVVVWLVLGLTAYFAYGMKHSVEGARQ